MLRAVVIEADAANRLSLTGGLSENWLQTLEVPKGIHAVTLGNICYMIGAGAKRDSRLLVVRFSVLSPLPTSLQLECFERILRAGLAEFRPGLVKLPLEWRIFHTGSLLSFQSNRLRTGISYRICIDTSPEGFEHVYAYHLSTSETEPLSRAAYDADLFTDAVLDYESVYLSTRSQEPQLRHDVGHLTVALTETFGDSNIALGIPFTTWRDVKLTSEQRKFFDAPFTGPLRVKGPAGTGKTLVLSMRFLKEVYNGIDSNQPIRGCFLAHGEETAENISKYLMQIDERGVLFEPDRFPAVALEITTLHGLANRYINKDTDNLQPLSLDGSQGRKMQFELIEAITKDFAINDWSAEYKEGCTTEFIAAIEAAPGSPARRSFTYDLSDEFANVLEALGVRSIDEIAPRYLRIKPSERALARNAAEKRVILALYRRFRTSLTEMGVFSLDQFTADFLAYLNSFRWDALRRDRGFDFVFADELHLFNAQERRVLGFLLREPEAPRRVAVAYDPRQSPRNSFFPEAVTDRDTIWTEAGLSSAIETFQLKDVFRYTPQILAFLERLNQKFPATNLAEEWTLNFGRSQIGDGPMPSVRTLPTQTAMAESASARARSLLSKLPKGEHLAVLCLDYDRFGQYVTASVFQDFVVVGGRDELGLIERFRRRPVLSMPEYVAGLQFNTVLLIDANASVVAELGSGANGLHRFISSVYLGASRAKQNLELFADASAGGFAEPIQDAIQQKLVVQVS